MAHLQNIDAAHDSLLLRNLPAPIVETLLSDAVKRNYGRGETLFLQGETAQSIHVVLNGWVKLYRVGPNGNEAVVNVFTRGHSFGEAIAFRSGDYPVSAEAVTDCTILLISARSFISTMRKEPDVALAVLASTFQHLHELVSQVEQIKAQTGAQRVAEFLLKLCECPEGECIVTLPYDKVLIAGRLGMKPESLSRAFAKLKPVGVTISRNHAAIKDIGALRDYAEEDPAAAWNKAT
ncbi:cAMP-binding domain of CRP or a regulatory subunit of cAMP-dependent protein kinases [Roseovarius pacificus]|uniref:cAMP-binding domain of CRP or a regulatory subunit of cAMP-dependent protein kinases n=1 Tax=Roseovarius pacificus TaxID=337701 RepID=A0A1M7K000_9RHOB|nr:Crp/Fnr family transcriptional regulator [Roseovarius pacificus]GGO62308.1 Crp/Fnr family transcriptional regulator [Roseovarius pacificus]SHM58534.1 cAMP-binding domain of CRP or a regulatory subunit of cAMP-dependent protein kinases [Roseovarius pacificus]